jgi:PadR family transcriptional regulator AphA
MAAKETTTMESLLGVLSLRPMSGYEIRQFMERSTSNFWSESFGQIYPALKRMLAEGLVEVQEHAGEDIRQRRSIASPKPGGRGCGRGWRCRLVRTFTGLRCC